MGRTGRVRWLVAAVATAATLVTAQGAWALTPPTVPANIKVPAGNTLFLVAHAQGAQVYRCTNTAGVYAWTLFTPAATLYDDAGRSIILHYAGPTWRAHDGSTVVAARVDGAPSPLPNTIPWLLLKATSTTPGSTGDLLTPTTYIQRVNTVGGVAPATGCDAAHVGATRPVFYTADYSFYRAA